MRVLVVEDERRLAREVPALAARVHWHDRWPEAIEGVVVGNEVLDAMPVQLLHWDGHEWFERGVRVTPLGPRWRCCGTLSMSDVCPSPFLARDSWSCPALRTHPL